MDPHGLLAAACQQFVQVDTYHRGLITAAAFSKALAALGLRYGEPKVDEILQYCTITKDGYVHYKELLHLVSPATPRAKGSSAKEMIFPAEQNAAASSHPSQVSPGSAPAEDIRRIYARWDRGQISNEGLKEGIRQLGVAVAPELERLLLVYGPSRGMPFGKLMSALQIDTVDGRRGRRPWQETEVEDDLRSEDGLQAPALRQVMCDFLDGRTPAVTFRRQLERLDIMS